MVVVAVVLVVVAVAVVVDGGGGEEVGALGFYILIVKNVYTYHEEYKPTFPFLLVFP